ncbi:heparinase, partial [Flagellimonas olearia]
WVKCFVSGIDWLEAMSHPDGDVSFFNDAAFGISPNSNDLKSYSLLLGDEGDKNSSIKSLRGTLLEQSGYAVVEWPACHKLLVDLAHVGPDYQPGHAHADTLSCELSLFGCRVLVNSGTS